MDMLLKMAMFVQWFLLFLLFFAINCIFICVLLDVINQGIQVDVILTLAKFYSASAIILKQRGLKDNIYFE